MKLVRTYSLEWLDSLVSVTLHPDKPYRHKLQGSDIPVILEKVPVESLQVQAELTAQLFALNKESQVQHLVSKYHDALMSLRHAILSYRNNTAFKPDELQGLDELLYKCLGDLILFVENRFGAYIKPTPPSVQIPQKKKIWYRRRLLQRMPVKKSSARYLPTRSRLYFGQQTSPKS